MILKFIPIAISKVWGGTNLSKLYNIDLDNIGEIIGISAHHTNSNLISNGPFKGLSFREFFFRHKEYFGNYRNHEFPLLFKIIDAIDDLSIQVHPKDEYARIHENQFGKDECWYILNCSIDARIQIGHHAKSVDEIKEALNNHTLENLLDYHKVNIHDYYYIPSGKVHAICKNTTLLEVSQSSDVTYRLYDYNRLDRGKLRELHIDKSLDVISVPDTLNLVTHVDDLFKFEVLNISDLHKTSDIYGDYLYVIDGSGNLNDEVVSKGEFIMVTSLFKYKLTGNLKIALVNIIK
jgi:mannose-6-phosphate isomerase